MHFSHDPSGTTQTMISVDEARERILACFAPLTPRRTPLLDALGLVLAEPIIARESIPPFTNSAMDGYAVRASDTRGACPDRPAELRVIGEAPAGTPSPRWFIDEAIPLRIESGMAIRIMTGAVLPPGADAVVRFEDTDESDTPSTSRSRGVVRIRREITTGENVRHAGEDILAGSIVFEPGTVLGPAHLGLLASLGYSWVLVHPRPRIAILATGD
jgi:molybdopterin molybdotransferase